MNQPKKQKLKSTINARHVFISIMILVYIYLIGVSLYQCIIGKGIDACRLELALIVLISIIIYGYSCINSILLNQQKNLKKLQKNQTKKQRTTKIIYQASYLSLMILTIIYLLLAYDMIYIDFYAIIPKHLILSVVGTGVMLFIIVFIIIFSIIYYFSERKPAKNK